MQHTAHANYPTLELIEAVYGRVACPLLLAHILLVRGAAASFESVTYHSMSPTRS